MITIVVSSLVALLLLVGLGSNIFLPTDNPIEESCEEGIKLLTGQDIDITPWTPEPRWKNQQSSGSSDIKVIVEEPNTSIPDCIRLPQKD